ncbi:MAG: cell division protein FtsL [Holosporaceae bacterium]|jgi:cell division protein FtsL|nr:cell division protein FtsL [Holosporaceae bacterium]
MITKKSSLFLAILICATGAWLFYLKYSVVSMENRLHKLRREIASERKNQHILKAEWKALSSPERIQRLATRHLKMRQIEPKQLMEFDASIFHSEKKKYKETKRLSKLVDEIVSQESPRR